MAKTNRRKRTLIFLGFSFAVAAVLCGALYWVYSTLNSKERFMKIVQGVLNDAKVPIQINSIDGNFNLKDLLRGKVKDLRFKATLLPLLSPFEGEVQINLGNISEFDFQLKSLAPITKSIGAITLKAGQWQLGGKVFWDKSPPIGKLPFEIESQLKVINAVFSKDSIWIEEPLMSATLFTNTDTKVFRALKFNLEQPLNLAIEADGSLGGISGKFNFANPLQAIVDDRIVPWFSTDFGFLRRAKAKGKIQAAGDFSFFPNEKELEKKIKLKAQMHLTAKRLEIPGKAFSFEDLDFLLPLSFPDDPSFGLLKLKALQYQSIKLNPLQLRIKATHEYVDVTTEKPNGTDLPLVQPLWGSEIKVSELYASYDFKGAPEFTLSVEGGPFSMSKIQSDLCVVEDKPLDGWIKFSYPEFVQDDKALHLLGKTEMQIFNGSVEMGDLHFLFDDPQPKINFSAEWNNLDMHAIGDWVGFGDMRGSLQGSFKDVVVVFSPVGPVATSYDFVVQGVQRAETPVRLYGRAVKNIMRLLGTDPQEMPTLPKLGLTISTGFLNIFPLKIDYMGFHAKTNGGWTELRTFDPDDDGKPNNDKKHYLLKGSAFTIPFRAMTFEIPLNSHGIYPAILKTEAFQFWLRQMLDIFKELAKAGKGKTDEKKECVPIF